MGGARCTLVHPVERIGSLSIQAWRACAAMQASGHGAADSGFGQHAQRHGFGHLDAVHTR